MFCNFKSSWITQEEGMPNKTNVGSVAMCIYGQVVSFSMDHSKLKEALSEGRGTDVQESVFIQVAIRRSALYCPMIFLAVGEC